jgi:hypothetical protein
MSRQMADLFNNQPGVVAVLDTDGGDDNPFRVTLDDFPQIGAQSGVIFTELAIQRHGSFQFMHTLRDLVYVYSFGERVGQIRASGMAFARMCSGIEGLSTVMDYYENNRLERRADPISIVVGTTSRFRGFLTELNTDIARPEARLAQFGLQFLALPSAKPKAAAASTPKGGGGPGSFQGTVSKVGAPATGGNIGNLGGGLSGGLVGGMSGGGGF